MLDTCPDMLFIVVLYILYYMILYYYYYVLDYLLVSFTYLYLAFTDSLTY